MADRGDGLVLAAELAHERDRFLAEPQLIRIRHAAGKDEGVEVRGKRVAHVHVHGEAVAVLEVVECLHLVALVLGRHQRHLRAVLLEEIARPGVFDFLHAVGHQHRDALSLQLDAALHHLRLLVCVSIGRPRPCRASCPP